MAREIDTRLEPPNEYDIQVAMAMTILIRGCVLKNRGLEISYDNGLVIPGSKAFTAEGKLKSKEEIKAEDIARTPSGFRIQVADLEIQNPNEESGLYPYSQLLRGLAEGIKLLEELESLKAG